MKAIKIKRDNQFWKDEKSYSITDAKLLTLPSIKEVITTVGDNTYTATVFEEANGDFYFICSIPLYNDQFGADVDYISLFKENDPNLVQYLSTKIGDTTSTSLESKFNQARINQTNTFKNFLASGDDVLTFTSSIGFPDRKELDMVTKFWQNNIDAEQTSTYKKGDQITMSNVYSDTRTLFESSYGLTFDSTNAWPGQTSITFFDVEVKGGFVSSAAALAEAISFATKANTDQCNQFRTKFWNSETADNYTDELNKLVDAAQATVKERNEEVQKAEEAQEQANQDLSEAQENLANVTSKANEEYEECVKECGENPSASCVAACQATKDDAIAAAQANVDNAQAALDTAKANLQAAQAAYSEADLALTQASQNQTAQEERTQQIQEICGES